MFQSLLVILSVRVCAHLFLPIVFSLCLSLFWGGKMVILKVSSGRFGWLWRIIEREQIVDSYLQADSLDLAQYSVEMLGWRLFFPPNFLIDFGYISSLIWEHQDLQEYWKGRQLMDIKTCISMWYVTGLWSSLLPDKQRAKVGWRVIKPCDYYEYLDSSQLMITLLKVKFVLHIWSQSRDRGKTD